MKLIDINSHWQRHIEENTVPNREAAMRAIWLTNPFARIARGKEPLVWPNGEEKERNPNWYRDLVAKAEAEEIPK